jgi:flagellar biosynthetic protein FliQ
MLVVGLVTSLFQAVTSLQEQTVTFAPKLLALSALAILLAPWLLRSLSEYTITIFARMATLAH